MKNKNVKTFIAILFSVVCLCVFSCAEMFQGQLSLERTTANINDLLKDYSVKITLVPPSQVFASNGSSTTEIVVNWSAVEGATSYELWRAVMPKDENGNWQEPKDEDFVVLKSFVKDTGYRDVIVNNPTALSEEYNNRYFYRVCSCNIGKRLEPSDYSVPVYGTLLRTPVEVSADLGKNYDSIRVEWERVPNVSYYEIYCTKNADGTGKEKISTVNANVYWFNHTIEKKDQGVEFYYSIKAVNRFNVASLFSPSAMGFSLKDGAPGTPSEVTATRGSSLDRISVSWTGAGGDKFFIYRASSINKTELVKVGESVGTTFDDNKSLAENVYYYYQIQAVGTDAEGAQVKSAFSDSSAKSAKPAEGYILSSPQNFVASKILTGGINLSWLPALGSETEQADYTYTIYSCSTIDGTYTVLYDGIALTEFHDPAGANYYKISTKSISTGLESALSAVAAPAPLPAKNIAASRYANLGASYSPNQNQVFPVKITWSVPDGGAAGYDVYRSTKPDSGFRKINDAPVVGLEYVDTNEVAKPGIYYYYKVLSLNELMQGALFSDSMYGYGALTPEQYFLEYDKTIIMSHKHLTYINKSNDLDKLGTETKNGNISGTIMYDAGTQGIGARIIMKYTNYADFYIDDNPEFGRYFVLDGNTNTTAKMDSSGTMDGVVNINGMYPGSIDYNSLIIKGGDAGGGHYVVTRAGFPGVNVSWQVNK